MTPRREYRTYGLRFRRRRNRATLGRRARFEARGAVAVAARPRLVPVQVAAAAARVRVLDFLEVKELFPVLALFGQRRRAVADLDPLHAAVVELARGVHVAEVLVAGDRSASERAVVDRTCERLTLPGFDSGGDQIAHRSILPRGEQLDEGRERRVQLRVLRQQPELSGDRVRRGLNWNADDKRRSRGRAGHRRPGGARA